jgi:hypothetical protein
VPRPRLFFFNEQDQPALASTFTDHTIGQLRALQAGVAMGLRDLSDERAVVVRALEAAGVPVTGWLLLPREEGYFATQHNAPKVEAAYWRFHAWAARHRLAVPRVGLDFEPDLRELERLMQRPLSTLVRWALRPGPIAQVHDARRRYAELIQRVKAEGRAVEAYQFPLVVDDRARGGHFWQRTAGLLDVACDREVVMLYSSLLTALGPGVLARYAPLAQAVAVGSTGGGVDPFPKLSWDELSRDLRLAARSAGDVFIFSLEGCVGRGWLPRLAALSWDEPVTLPRWQNAGATVVARIARSLSSVR